MFLPGSLIFFKPFYFKNGNPAADKFCIILKWEESKGVIAALPSSQDYIPRNFEISSDCVEIPEANFNCFVFPKDVEVTETGFRFSKETIVYGHNLDIYEISHFDSYPIEGVHYFDKGKLKDCVFNKLKNCLVSSKSVKKKLVRMLTP